MFILRKSSRPDAKETGISGIVSGFNAGRRSSLDAASGFLGLVSPSIASKDKLVKRDLSQEVILSSTGLAARNVWEVLAAGSEEEVTTLCRKKGTAILSSINFPMDRNENCALHWSVCQNDLTLSHVLLIKGANPNQPNKSGVTPTVIAKRMNFNGVFRILVQFGGKLPPNEVNAYFASRSGKARHESHQRRSSEMHLVPKSSRTKGQSLSVLDSIPDLSIANVLNNNSSASNYTMQPGFSQSVSPAKQGAGPIGNSNPLGGYIPPVYDQAYIGILSGYLEINCLDDVDLSGCNALMKCAFKGVLDNVKTLVGNGSAVETVDSRGFNALAWACLEGHFSVVKYLIEDASASIEGPIDPKFGFKVITPLIAAVCSSNVSIVEYLLSFPNININERIGSGIGKSALMIAAWQLSQPIVDMLLKRGASIDNHVDRWLKTGILYIKKSRIELNAWVARGNDREPRRRRSSGAIALTQSQSERRSSLKDKLIFLSNENNEAYQNLLNFLNQFLSLNNSDNIRLENMRTAEESQHEGATLAPRPLNAGRDTRYQSFRQGLNVDKIVGESMEVIFKLTKQLPSRGTELDQQSLIIFHYVTQLTIAANRNIRQQFISIAANAIHAVGEICKRVEMGISSSATLATSSSTAWSALPFSHQLIRQKIKSIVATLTVEHPRQLMIKTRLAISAWPPPNSVAEMIDAAADMAQYTLNLVDIANILGNYPLLEKPLGITIPNVDNQSMGNSSDCAPVLSSAAPISNRLKGGLNYSEYKKTGDLQIIRERALQVNKSVSSIDQVYVDRLLPSSSNDGRFKSEVNAIVDLFVAAIDELKRSHESHLKDDFVNAASIANMRADSLIQCIQAHELMINFPDNLEMTEGDLEEIKLRTSDVRIVEALVAPCLWKPALLQSIATFEQSAAQILAKAKVACDFWSSDNAGFDMIQSAMQSLDHMTSMVFLIFEGTGKVRATASEDLKRKAAWSREWVRNEKVKQLFQLWEDHMRFQISSPGSLSMERLNEQVKPSECLECLLKDEEDGLVFETGKAGRPLLKGGTLMRLIDWITFKGSADTETAQVVLATYRSFTTSAELIDALIRRYDLAPPYGLCKSEFEEFLERKIVPVRLKVILVIKSWIEAHFEEDFADDEKLLLTLRDFVDHKVAMDFENMPGVLLDALDAKLLRTKEHHDNEALIDKNHCPKILMPRSLAALGTGPNLLTRLAAHSEAIFDIHPLELARQITLIEYDLFVKVKPYEYLNQIWDHHGRPITTNSPCRRCGITAMISHTNSLTLWVATQIITCKAVKERASRLKFFVQVALHCRELNNFNGLTGIVAALSMAPVHRLNKTWDYFEDKYPKLADAYIYAAEVVSPKGQYSEYRQTLKEISQKADRTLLPFLGVYLTDLTFIELGNPDFLPNSHFINLEKRRKVYAVVKDIKSYQIRPYHLTSIPGLQDFFLRIGEQSSDTKDFMENTLMTEDELYEESLIIEPREESNDGSSNDN